jgi:hypothetical protein
MLEIDARRDCPLSRKPKLGPAGVYRENGMLISKEIMTREAHLAELAQPLNFDSYDYVKTLKVTASSSLSDRACRANFRVHMPKLQTIELSSWSHRLADFLYNARSLLDNVMWAAVLNDPVRELTEREKTHVYFPIAESEEQWRSLAGQPLLQCMRIEYRERIESVQPFRRPMLRRLARWFTCTSCIE